MKRLEFHGFLITFAHPFYKNKVIARMAPIISHRSGIVTDRKGVSFSYRSPIGERTVKLSHAFIAKSASEAYDRVVNRKK